MLHVHRRIEGAELPVTHQTRRTGSPYTLVLTKTPELFERAECTARRPTEDEAGQPRDGWSSSP